jgi:hypothetical protein
VQYRRDSSAVVKHVMEITHRMDWERATCLEKEARTIPRKKKKVVILEDTKESV